MLLYAPLSTKALNRALYFDFSTSTLARPLMEFLFLACLEEGTKKSAEIK